MVAFVSRFLVLSFLLCSQLVASDSYHASEADAASDDTRAFFLKKDLSLTRPFEASNWDFSGSTLLTGEHVRLTSDQPSQSGAIWCTTPVPMRHWEVQLHFKVHGSAGSLFGDGMAFWYVEPGNRFGGPVFGNQDKFRGLAVLLDTYSNHNGPHSHDHPYISAMVNNGTVEYDHDRDGTHSQLAGCTARFRNRAHDTLVAISYVNNALTVSTDIDNKGSWERCLRVENVRLPTHFLFGVSAMTGDLSDNHDVVGVKVYEVEVPKRPISPQELAIDYRKVEPSASGAEAPRDHVDQAPPSRWTGFRIFLIIVFLIVGLGVGGFGIYYYFVKQEENRKRFY